MEFSYLQFLLWPDDDLSAETDSLNTHLKVQCWFCIINKHKYTFVTFVYKPYAKILNTHHSRIKIKYNSI
jgi:hypothetical protein